jgi:hypothetical protein
LVSFAKPYACAVRVELWIAADLEDNEIDRIDLFTVFIFTVFFLDLRDRGARELKRGYRSVVFEISPVDDISTIVVCLVARKMPAGDT